MKIKVLIRVPFFKHLIIKTNCKMLTTFHCHLNNIIRSKHCQHLELVFIIKIKVRYKNDVYHINLGKISILMHTIV